MVVDKYGGWKIWWVKDIVGENIVGERYGGWTCMWVNIYVGEEVCGWKLYGWTITVGEIYGGWTIKVGKHVCGLICMWVKAMLAKKTAAITVDEQLQWVKDMVGEQ